MTAQSTWKKSQASVVEAWVCAEELPPGRSAALRRGQDPQPSQHPPHGRGADADAQAEQFALDPLVAPARVLPRHLPDQRRDPRIHGRPAAAAGIGPPPADQAPVPAQRVRIHQPAHRQGLGEQPGQGSQHRPVGPVQLRPWGAAAEPLPRGAAPAVRRPSTPGARRSGRASAEPQAPDAASLRTSAAGEPAGQPNMPVLEPHRVELPTAGTGSAVSPGRDRPGRG